MHITLAMCQAGVQNWGLMFSRVWWLLRALRSENPPENEAQED
jgi:hypothetical protein